VSDQVNKYITYIVGKSIVNFKRTNSNHIYLFQ